MSSTQNTISVIMTGQKKGPNKCRAKATHSILWTPFYGDLLCNFPCRDEMWSELYSSRCGTANRLKKGSIHIDLGETTDFLELLPGCLVSLRQLHLGKAQSNKQGSLLTFCIPGTSALPQAAQPQLPSPKQLLTAHRTPESSHINILTFCASWSLSISMFLYVMSHPPPSRRDLTIFKLFVSRQTQPQCHFCFIQFLSPLGLTPPKHRKSDSTLLKGTGIWVAYVWWWKWHYSLYDRIWKADLTADNLESN